MCIHIFACQEISGIALAVEGSWWPPAASGSPSSGFPGGNLLPWVRAWEQSEMPVEVVTWWGSWGGRRRAVPSCAVPCCAVLCHGWAMVVANHGHAKLWPRCSMAVLSPFCGHAVIVPWLCHAVAVPQLCHGVAVPCHGRAMGHITPMSCRGCAMPCLCCGGAVPCPWPCSASAVAMLCHGHAVAVPWPCYFHAVPQPCHAHDMPWPWPWPHGSPVHSWSVTVSTPSTPMPWSLAVRHFFLRFFSPAGKQRYPPRCCSAQTGRPE